MKVLAYIFKLLAVPALSALVLASCADDFDATPSTGVAEEEVTFVFELPAHDDVQTRGTVGVEKENTILDATVLLFDPVTKVLLFKVSGTGIAPAGDATNNNKWTFSARIISGTYDLIAVANVSPIIHNIVPGPTVTKSTVARALVLDTTFLGESNKWLVATGLEVMTSIPMWGELDNVKLKGSLTSPTFSMLRALASINITVDPSANFNLDRLRFFNYNTKGYLIPDPDNRVIADGETVGVSAPTTYSQDMGTKLRAGLLYSGAEITSFKSCTNMIYVYEAASVGEFSMSENDWIDNPCLVVGGVFDPASASSTEPLSFYRIDFIDSSTGGWLSILRNKRYNVRINNVHGHGYATYTDALEAAPLNMDASTYVVDESDKSVVLQDGPYYMALSEHNIVIPRSESRTTRPTIKLSTNFPGWHTKIYNDAECTQEMTVGWMSISPDRGSSDNDIAITVSLTTDEIGSRYIKFTAGRMTQVVKVSCSIAADFARSHVVGNYNDVGTTLSFATSETDNVALPSSMQGLHFRFGSLIGISSFGDDRTHWQPYFVTFMPIEYTGPMSWTWAYDSGDDKSTNIPYCNASDAVLDDFFATGFADKRYNAESGIGDICTYISDKGWVSGRWRTPTDEEWLLLWDETAHKNGSMAGKVYRKPDYTNNIVQDYGLQLMESGVWLGVNTDGNLSSYEADMPPAGTIFLPASGYRTGPTDGAYAQGDYRSAGTEIYAWSASSKPRIIPSTRHSTLRARNIYGTISSGVFQSSEFVRGDAMPVRCIKE